MDSQVGGVWTHCCNPFFGLGECLFQPREILEGEVGDNCGRRRVVASLANPSASLLRKRSSHCCALRALDSWR